MITTNTNRTGFDRQPQWTEMMFSRLGSMLFYYTTLHHRRAEVEKYQRLEHGMNGGSHVRLHLALWMKGLPLFQNQKKESEI